MATPAMRFGLRVQELVEGVTLAAFTCTKDVARLSHCGSRAGSLVRALTPFLWQHAHTISQRLRRRRSRALKNLNLFTQSYELSLNEMFVHGCDEGAVLEGVAAVTVRERSIALANVSMRNVPKVATTAMLSGALLKAEPNLSSTGGTAKASASGERLHEPFAVLPRI